MDKKDELLQNALRLFQAQGYEKVGIQAIVDSANVGKPTLYYYFKNKRGLLACIIDQHFKGFVPKLRKACEYSGDITMTLEKIVAEYFDFAMSYNIFYRWYLAVIPSPENGDPGTLIQPYLQEQLEMVTQVFMAAASDHGNMKGRHHRYAFTFLGMINATITTAHYGLILLNDEIKYLTCKQFMHGIFS